MALEMNTYMKPPVHLMGTWGGAMALLMAKYDRVKAEEKAAKGKERERLGPDVPTDVREGEGVDVMNVG